MILHVFRRRPISDFFALSHFHDHRYKDIVTNANTADTEKYEHLTDEQRSEVIKKCDEVTSWLDAKRSEQSNLPKNVDPVLK